MAGQAPTVTDPAARVCLAAASAATTAVDYLLCAVRDGEPPNRDEIVEALADSLNVFLTAYPGDDVATVSLHNAACEVLGVDVPDYEQSALAAAEAAVERPEIRAGDKIAKALLAASHALRSYQHGNSAPDLARQTADACDAALAQMESR